MPSSLARLAGQAGVVELADTRDLGSRAERREGSSPFPGTGAFVSVQTRA